MSKIEVNQISSQCGSTLTIGQSGDTVTLASGATQTGFGRTGTVDWCTTAKTAPFTGVSGKGYFVNTSCGAVTVTLPATPTAGDIVSVADYTNTWQTNNVTLCGNLSNIGGEPASAILSVRGQSVTFVYVDATEGWKNVQDSTSNVTGKSYTSATGGTITTCGDYKIHTFTADGCFTVTTIGNPAGGGCKASYVVVAGGGSGGSENAPTTTSGGGGAGGYREGKLSTDPYTASPLNAGDGITLTATTYPITVGGGGALVPSSSTTPGNNGSPSVFSSITSAGGGGGSGDSSIPGSGLAGGSGGGAKQQNTGGPASGAGAGNTPPVSPPQGNPGGLSDYPGPTYLGGGGGGAGAPGGSPNPSNTGAGGDGVTSSITGTPVARAGGGGSGRQFYAPQTRCKGAGGLGGGGAGQPGPGVDPGSCGSANTGGGGGGAAASSPAISSGGGAGGSGIVIIRYKFQN